MPTWKFSQFATTLLLLVLLSSPVRPAESSDTTPLALSEAMNEALQFNRTLKIQQSTVRERRSTVRQAQGAFEPRVNVSSTISREERDEANFADIDRTENYDYRAGVEKPLRNGDRLSFNVESLEDEQSIFFPGSNVTVPGSNRQGIQSSLTLRYVKPLFEGAGRKVAMTQVRRAEIRTKLAQQQYKDRVAQVLFNVFRDYFDLYRARAELRVQRELLGFLERIRDIVKMKVDKRTLPINALTQVRAALLTQKNQIEDVRNTVRQRQYNLMFSIYNDPRVERARRLSPTTVPEELITRLTIGPRESTLREMRRQDIKLIEFRSQKNILHEQRTVAKNELYPDLTLTSEAGLDGFDPEGRSESFSDISGDNYHFKVQAILSFPATEQEARNRLIEIQEQLEQLQYRIQNRLEELSQIATELYDDLDTTRLQVKRAKDISGLARKNLNQEIRRLVAGRSTVLDTLQFQREYSTARLSLLQRRVELIQLKGTYFLLRRDMKRILTELQGSAETSSDTPPISPEGGSGRGY